MNNSNVTVIPATCARSPIMAISDCHAALRRVAGYGRVSTGSEEQETSYEAQLDYYTRYIKSHSDWDFVGMYADEARSGLQIKGRAGFSKMISDALSGSIDLIITKSVSRFARNTVDTLTTIRKLKEKGIGVYFEKEAIDSLDAKGELLLTIMSSLAQEESRSISENVTWGQRKRFSDGKFTLPYKQFLGYDKGENGMPVINESEAETVRMIYRLFLEGKTPTGIANALTDMGIPTPARKKKWLYSTVKSILTNEKYSGCALLQKEYTVDFLTKTRKTNEGEIPQYYVEGSHEAIISPEIFEMVKSEMKRREQVIGYSGRSSFGAKIICGDCGEHFGAKTWHSRDIYKRTIYRCNAKYSPGKPRCGTGHFSEYEIKSRFVSAVNQILTERKGLFDTFEEIREKIFDTSELDSEYERLKAELAITAELVQQCVNENARKKQNQAEYKQQYETLSDRYDTAKARIGEISRLRSDKKLREQQVGSFLLEFRKMPEIITDYDDNLWQNLLEKAVVGLDMSICFQFRDGTVVTV